MDAMILAAGVGRRLGPLTETRPKALVEVGGTPMLEWVALRLIDAGADRLVINLHHHPGEIRAFVEAREGFGVDVRFSLEAERPLETGGGIVAAAPHFRGEKPFFIHNCDIITGIDLEALYAAHEADADAVATLAVGGRTSQRYLVFDDGGLCGYGNEQTGLHFLVRDPGRDESRLPFAGIHVARPDLPERIARDEPAFSIIDAYVRLAREGYRIAAHDVGEALWLEVGNPARLARARRWAAARGIRGARDIPGAGRREAPTAPVPPGITRR